ncbi:MAG TPA: hypothetical protein VMA34_11120 [Terracidiphilus sp.]|nr:hypothetical protein [Terracidiphilus sp.]
MKRSLAGLVLSLLFAASAPAAPAQDAAPLRAPDFRAPYFIAPLYFPPVKNAPFMAIAKTLVVRILPDGSTVTSENARVVARDMDGRIFQERRTFVPVPNPDNRQSMVRVNEYTDPVAHTRYVCNPYMKVCNLFFYQPIMDQPPAPVGLRPGGRTYLTRQNLGTDLFDGQEAIHTQETLTIYSQTIGNTNNIIRQTEYWYSPSLGINLKVVRHDPRDGDQTLWLENLSQSAPDPGTFRPPNDFRIVDHTHPEAPAGAAGNTR